MSEVPLEQQLDFQQIRGYSRATSYVEVLTPGAVATGTSPTAVTWTAARKNAAALWSSGANTKLTVRTAGVYRVSAFLNWGTNATGERILWLRLNGSTLFSGNSTVPTADGSPLACSGLIDLQVGDYVEAIAVQTSGGNITPTGFFTAVRVSPL